MNMHRCFKKGETELYDPIEFFHDVYELELVEVRIICIVEEENETEFLQSAN